MPSIPIVNPLSVLSKIDVVGGATGTLTSLRSVRGVKQVLERIGMYGAATVVAFSVVSQAHFGGVGNGNMNKALGLTGKTTGVLAVVSDAYLGNPLWAYLQTMCGVVGIFNMAPGSDFPAHFTAFTLALHANTVLAASSFGVRETIIRNAMAFKYANAVALFCTTAKAKSMLSSRKVAALKKCAATVPVLMMNFLFMQGASMAKFAAAGMKGPGILGPVAGLIFHPLFGVTSAMFSLAYLSGFSGRRASIFLFFQFLIVTVSITPQLVQPWGHAMTALHLGQLMVFANECIPKDSLIPRF